MTFNKIAFLVLAIFLLFLAIIYALMAGNYDINFTTIKNVFLNELFNIQTQEFKKMDKVIIYDIRFPRIIMAILVGFSLGIAGSIYQGCFKNPLVEPFILGASSGAAFGASLAIIFALKFISFWAFIFSIFAVFVSYFLAKDKENISIVSLILSGVIVGSIFSALVSILKYISDDAGLREITFWIMGGLYYSNLKDGLIFAAVIFIVFMIVLKFSYRLNLLALGDDEAKSLGIDLNKNKLFFILLATLVSSLSVANVGIIAWIGLMMPHATRLIVGADNRWVLPLSGLLGAIYLLFCDTIARTLTHTEIPVGIITSILGAPFLIYLLKTKKSRLLK
ncbi:FecCD family ABC transporter permease [Campylobacter ureolyticus]|uniref:Metal ion ABC transporter, permease protein n=1 Tax=Campylobacter ureolyticus TaxID=827 RepID=A0AAE7E9L5_9BACT|nr:iron ABC transporter permease [Campylobacter ureolyticus]MCR8685452.1 iron ABC transporter permease [Campylobacter ureolyticus]QKF84214.1 metal ion ABC transporter, permease protein [Campylobacter ureolyticus]SUX23691.1 HmuU protein [Campylobacter ureolyticus]